MYKFHKWLRGTCTWDPLADNWTHAVVSVIERQTPMYDLYGPLYMITWWNCFCSWPVNHGSLSVCFGVPVTKLEDPFPSVPQLVERRVGNGRFASGPSRSTSTIPSLTMVVIFECVSVRNPWCGMTVVASCGASWNSSSTWLAMN